MNFLIFWDFLDFLNFSEFKINLFDLNSLLSRANVAVDVAREEKSVPCGDI